MSIIKTICNEIVKVSINKIVIWILGFGTLITVESLNYFKTESHSKRLLQLESNFNNEIPIRTAFSKFLTNCPSYTALGWVEYNQNTNKILFKKVVAYDETFGIYDATTTNDLYSRDRIDSQSLHYFASLEEDIIYFVEDNDQIWTYSLFSAIRLKAWKYTNDKIVKHSKAEYAKKINKLHGSDGIQVRRLHNAVIKDSKRNLIYVISLAMSGNSRYCFSENEVMTRVELLGFVEEIKLLSNVS